jgi:predicted nucleotide-binding protein
MARINQDLLERLRTKLGVGQSRIYALIDEKVRIAHLPRPLAAIALASERGINISKFASAEDLAIIRHAGISAAPASAFSTPTGANAEVKSRKRKTTSKRSTEPRRGTTVFVVHGRNHFLRESMFAFLRSIGLRPLEWTQAIRMTKEASPYIGTILETAFREAAAVVVLLTPDDEAKLKEEFVTTRDPAHEKRLTGQARPNVLFEAGMAFGKDPTSTVLVQIGDIRPFSDVAGRHVVHLNNEPARRQELMTKLANAGCNVDATGTDWMSAGNFQLSASTRRLNR